MTSQSINLFRLAPVAVAVIVSVMICTLPAFAAPAQDESAAAEEKEEKPVAPVEIPKSKFENDVQGKGVDPFFPKSTRRNPPPPPEPEPAESEKANETEPPPPPPPKPHDYFEDLTLKGLIGGSRPMATVNSGIKNYSFMKGDEPQVLRVTNPNTGTETNIVIEVHEFHSDSIVLTIDDKTERRTLPLQLPPG